LKWLLLTVVSSVTISCRLVLTCPLHNKQHYLLS
jgi:hypothetical protein